MLYWQGGRKLRGVLLGLTLATNHVDIVQAFMESIAYDHVNTLSLLNEEGVQVNQIRATGGGTRSEWWTQLKADLLQVPIEVVAEPEPGTLGAALLAGVGIGVFNDLDEASQACAGSSRVHQPDPARAELHRERLKTYQNVIPNLLSTVFEHGL
jgi:xylulokinase